MIALTGITSYKLGEVFERKKSSPYWAVGYIHHGTIQVEIDKKNFFWPSKTFGLTKPNMSYNIKYGTKQDPLCKESWVIFAPRDNWSFLMNWPEIVPGVMRLSVFDPQIEGEMLDLLKSVDSYVNGVLPDKNFFAENCLERFFLLANLVNPMADYAKISKQILATMDYIVQHYGEDIMIETLSEIATLSPSRFAHLFRQQVGVSPMKYLEQHRMEKARQLLISSQKPIKEIAESVGFNCPFYFSTRFRKNTGKSPKTFRDVYHNS